MTSQGLDAAKYLEHLRSTGSVVPSLPDGVVLAMHPGARPRRAKALGGPFGAVERERDGVVTVSTLGPGSAVAAMTIEMLAALGVRTVVGVGIASAVDTTSAAGAPDRPAGHVGDVFVVTSAGPGGQVSAAYGGVTDADADLSARLRRRLEVSDVRAWSTPVPFRLDLDAVVRDGAHVVEMEASALFAAGAACGVAVALAVVVSDVSSTSGWQAPTEDPSAVVADVAGVARSLVREVAT